MKTDSSSCLNPDRGWEKVVEKNRLFSRNILRFLLFAVLTPCLPLHGAAPNPESREASAKEWAPLDVSWEETAGVPDLFRLPQGEGNAAYDYMHVLGNSAKSLPFKKSDLSYIRKATRKRVCRFYPDHVSAPLGIGPSELDYSRVLKAAEDLNFMAQEAFQEGSEKSAREIYNDLFIFGYHLFAEPLSLEHVSHGLMLESIACQGMLVLLDAAEDETHRASMMQYAQASSQHLGRLYKTANEIDAIYASTARLDPCLRYLAIPGHSTLLRGCILRHLGTLRLFARGRIGVKTLAKLMEARILSKTTALGDYTATEAEQIEAALKRCLEDPEPIIRGRAEAQLELEPQRLEEFLETGPRKAPRKDRTRIP